MATGRTIGANHLTDKDRKVIELCGIIAQTILDEIPCSNAAKKFRKEFGKTSLTRDAGVGLGAGKFRTSLVQRCYDRPFD